MRDGGGSTGIEEGAVRHHDDTKTTYSPAFRDQTGSDLVKHLQCRTKEWSSHIGRGAGVVEKITGHVARRQLESRLRLPTMANESHLNGGAGT